MKIDIKLSAVIFASLFIILDASGTALPVMAAALLHEAGHLAAMYLLKIKPDSITVYPFGADIVVGQAISSYRDDIIIAAAGCAVNIVLAAVTFAFLPVFSGCCALFAAMNLLPIKSLDGGRILECVLLLKTSSDRAEPLIKAVSFFFIMPLWAASIYLLFYWPNNPTLFFVCVFLFASIFIKKEGGAP